MGVWSLVSEVGSRVIVCGYWFPEKRHSREVGEPESKQKEKTPCIRSRRTVLPACIELLTPCYPLSQIALFFSFRCHRTVWIGCARCNGWKFFQALFKLGY